MFGASVTGRISNEHQQPASGGTITLAGRRERTKQLRVETRIVMAKVLALETEADELENRANEKRRRAEELTNGLEEKGKRQQQ